MARRFTKDQVPGGKLPGTEPFKTAAQQLLAESGCVVTEWRSYMAGSAYTDSDDYEIEVPEPRGAVSFAIFAHEVGHQMLHRRNTSPRWREELEAWQYALDQFDRFDLPDKEKCIRRASVHTRYAYTKALRRSKPGRLWPAILDWVPEWMLPVDREKIAQAAINYGKVLPDDRDHAIEVFAGRA